MKSNFVSIIIPTYKDWHRLRLCLAALETQTYPKGNFEVIIVNNAKEKPPSEFELEANFKLVTEPQRGSYAARNTGISLAKGDIFGFTDSDCIPHETWIESAVQFLDQITESRRIGGKIELFISSNEPNIAELYELMHAFPQKDYVEKELYAATANMFAHRNVFEKVGLFRADMLSGGDQEWGKRASEKGETITYSDNTVVKHPARNSIKRLAAKSKRLARGHVILRARHKGAVPNSWKDFLYRVRPPVRKLWLAIFGPGEIPKSKRIILTFLSYYLRVVHEHEMLRQSRESVS